MTVAVKETRKLVAHEKLLIDVIKRQAGTLKKAILEGTMNSVEAGATEIDINFLAEKRIVDVLSYLGCWDGRKIRIGVSDVAAAWTDGSSFIALDRSWLKSFTLTSVGSVLGLFTTLCHEMAHDTDTAGTHNHGPEFYEKYYEITKKGSWQNPLHHVYKFSEKMDKERIETKRIQEETKEKDLQESLVAASSS